jgi:radical SAM protein with 4Fe4S-binding SPASM domain
LAEWTEKKGIEDTSALRFQPEEIQLFDDQGEKLTCRRPWDTIAIHASGNVHPCMSWSRGPIGNIAYESFDQIWNGQRLKEIREEISAEKPGIDCQHCVIKKGHMVDEDTDFFFKMLNSPPPRQDPCRQAAINLDGSVRPQGVPWWCSHFFSLFQDGSQVAAWNHPLQWRKWLLNRSKESRLYIAWKNRIPVGRGP